MGCKEFSSETLCRLFPAQTAVDLSDILYFICNGIYQKYYDRNYLLVVLLVSTNAPSMHPLLKDSHLFQRYSEAAIVL